MPYVWDFAILGKYSHLFWLGIGWTMAYTIGTIVLGTLIGLIVGILRLRRLPVIDNDRVVGILAQADVVLEVPDKKAGHLVEEISQPSTMLAP